MRGADHFLGIDVGTSGVKALLVARSGRVTASATVRLAMATPEPGWAEQDPEDWWRATCGAVRRVLAGSRLPAGRVVAIGLSGQMHSSVFLDRAGAVIRPAMLWCDGRTTAECRALTARVGEANLRAWTSNPALEGFTLPKILWLRRHEPAAFRRLAKVVLPKDYVRYRLTGTLATEPSDASGTLLFDTAGRRWSLPMLRAARLSRGLLPDLGGSHEVLGRVAAAPARATGLLAGTPVAGGGADNACGAVGVGAVVPGLVVASWGTSGTVLAPTRSPKVDARLRAHTFCHAAPDLWYVMGVMLSAGGAFAWFRDTVAGHAGHASASAESAANRILNDEAARVPPGALGLTFLPYLQGERTPHRNASARGAFVGLNLAHRRPHLARAVLEGIAFGLRDSLAILRDLRLPIERLLLTGGGAASPFLRQLQADVYGVPVETVNREEGPAYGAALLAAVAAGAFPDVVAACRANLARQAVVRPRPGVHRALAAPYRRFRDLYPMLRPAFHDPP